METLRSVFPDVPAPALQRVLEICDNSVEAASEWILENNWRDLLNDDLNDDLNDAYNNDADATAADHGDYGDNDNSNVLVQLNADTSNGATSAAPGAIDTQQQQQTHTAPTRMRLTHSSLEQLPPHYAHRSGPPPLMAARRSQPILDGYARRSQSIPDGYARHTSTSVPPPTSASVEHQQQQHSHVVDAGAGAVAVEAGAASAPALPVRALGRHDDREFDSSGEHDGESDEYEEDEDEDGDDDDDDEDDDEDDEHAYYDSGDDAFYPSGSGGGNNNVLPLAKRIKITAAADASASAVARDPKQELYWVAFDGQVVCKTLIELLNTTLSKLAHSKVTLLNKSTKHITERDANAKLVSVLDTIEQRRETSSSRDDVAPSAATAATASRSDDLSSSITITNAIDDTKPAAVRTCEHDTKPSPTATASANGQKRKRTASDESAATSARAPLGFFAHFFSVSDLDMIWRSVMHAHLFNARFGEMIEFHTASCGVFHKRDFDELMHIQSTIATSRAASMGLSPVAALKCCLILPCVATESEIFRVGKHLHSLLKLQGSLYYRTLDDDDAVVAIATASSTATVAPVAAATTSSAASAASSATTAPLSASPLRSARRALLNDDGKMTEDSFRRFARYRIKKEEHEIAESKDAQALTPDHFLAYQQQRKVEYCLQVLEADGWDRRLSS